MQSRRNFLRQLIGTAIAAPLGAFAARDVFVPFRYLDIADLGFVPPGEWGIIRMTAEEARLLGARYRWEAWLCRQMMDQSLADQGYTREARRALLAEARKT